VSLRRAAELALHKALYDGAPGAFAIDGTAQAILHLHKCCDDVGDVSTEEAVFGSVATGGRCLVNCMQTSSCDIDDIRLPIDAERAALAASGLLTRISIPADMLLAIRLYTFGSPNVKFFAAINNPFHESDRSIESPQNQLPYVRLLIRALRAVGATTGFHRGVVYRGAAAKPGSYLYEVYNNYIAQNEQNGLVAGRILRFPIFTSTSLSQSVAERNFAGAVVYIIKLNHDIGVNISQVSYFAVEQEVLLIPPASFVIREVRMVGTTLYI
jgi:hypothetical protein